MAKTTKGKWKPCLRCDEPTPVTPEYHLCPKCRVRINEEKPEVPRRRKAPLPDNILDRWRQA